MSLRTRKRERKKAARFHRTFLKNIRNTKAVRASKGKAKACLKCPASLLCNTNGGPKSVYRCKHCNKTVAVWGTTTYAWDPDRLSGFAAVDGVRRCPNVKIYLVACHECKKKLELGTIWEKSQNMYEQYMRMRDDYESQTKTS